MTDITEKCVFETRVERLKHLISSEFDGNQSKFCKKTGISQPQVSHWFTGAPGDRRKISEVSARRIESILGKHIYWLDGVDESYQKDWAWCVRQKMSRANSLRAQLIRVSIEKDGNQDLFVIDGIDESGFRGRVVVRSDYVIPLIVKLLYIYDFDLGLNK